MGPLFKLLRKVQWGGIPLFFQERKTIIFHAVINYTCCREKPWAIYNPSLDLKAHGRFYPWAVTGYVFLQLAVL